MANEIYFKSHLTEVLQGLKSAKSNGLEAVGMRAETHAKHRCPVDTGRLRNSINYAVDMSEEAVYIGTNVEYAPYVELGTSRQRAQPFLRPAATEHGAEYRRILEAALKSAK